MLESKYSGGMQYVYSCEMLLLTPCVINLVFRAADWQLTNPNWRGRMRIVIKGDSCCIKLEDRISGNQCNTIITYSMGLHAYLSIHAKVHNHTHRD